MSRVYFGDWSDYDGMARDWAHYDDGHRTPVDGMATPAEVLFAAYRYEDYTGNATVIFERGGKLFEVEGSHCSCNGLEGQRKPGEVTWPALALRVPDIEKALENNDYGPLYGLGPEARRAFVALVKSRTGAQP